MKKAGWRCLTRAKPGNCTIVKYNLTMPWRCCNHDHPFKIQYYISLAVRQILLHSFPQLQLHDAACTVQLAKHVRFPPELFKELCWNQFFCFAFGLLCCAKLVNNNVLSGIAQYLVLAVFLTNTLMFGCAVRTSCCMGVQSVPFFSLVRVTSLFVFLDWVQLMGRVKKGSYQVFCVDKIYI
jgi:hypothetical protein